MANLSDLGAALFSIGETVSASAVGSTAYNTTITAIVSSIEDAESGIHIITYQGSRLRARSDNDKIYSVGTSVLVNVPNNDLSQTLNITGTASISSTGEIVAVTDKYETIDPSWDSFYNYTPSDTWKVTAAPEVEYNMILGSSVSDGTTSLDSTADKLFYIPSSNYSMIRIKASFKLGFSNTHTKGNYGVVVGLRIHNYDTEDPDDYTVMQVKLDTASFTGSYYYSSSYWIPQYADIAIPAGTILGVQYIAMFQDGFDRDVITSVVDGVIVDVDPPQYTSENIGMSGLEINFMKEITEETSYSLKISARDGVCFTSSATNLKLTGVFTYAGEDVLSEDTCECYWYKEVLSQLEGNTIYLPGNDDPLTRKRWELITSSTLAGSTILDFNNLTVKGSDVNVSQYYKLLVHLNPTSNESSYREAEVEVFHLNKSPDLEISQTVVNGQTVLSIQSLDSTDTKEYVGDWYTEVTSTKAYNPVQEGLSGDPCYNVNSITTNSLSLTSSQTVFCAVKEKYGDDDYSDVIVNLRTSLITPTSEDDIEVTFSGPDYFVYSAEGGIQSTCLGVEQIMTALVEFKAGVSTDYLMHWFVADEVFTEYGSTTRTDISGSMFKNVYVNTIGQLCFQTHTDYETARMSNNTIGVTINTMDGSSFTYKKPISFVKDGDQGTNGTLYRVDVAPHTVDWYLNGGMYYEDVAETQTFFPLIRYGDNQWGNRIMLLATPYKQNVDISEFDRYSVTYKWTTKGCQISSSSTGRIVEVIPNSNYVDTNDVTVTLTMTIIDTEDTTASATTKVYHTHPIPMLIDGVSETLPEAEAYLKHVTETLDHNLPSQVLYTASGYYPQYVNERLRFNVTMEDGEVVDVIDQLESHDKSIVYISFEETTKPIADEWYELVPATMFVSTIDCGKFKCPLDGNSAEETAQYLVYPILMHLNIYGNEAINGWDGTSISTENGAVLAPQVGAGYKNEYNQFTGVIMGKDTSQIPEGYDTSEGLTGLYGYRDGVTTFGLKEDGTAFFGASDTGGRIDFSGIDGTIEGGGGGSDEHGMTIKLSNKTDTDSDPETRAIWIGGTVRKKVAKKYQGNREPEEGEDDIYEDSDNFSVLYDGTLTAQNANISGTITAEYGEIGGWGIGSLSNSVIGIGSNRMQTDTNAIFAFEWEWDEEKEQEVMVGKAYISSLGEMWFGHCDFSQAPFSVTSEGRLTSTSGYIGGFSIYDDNLIGPQIYCRNVEAMGVTLRRKDLGDEYGPTTSTTEYDELGNAFDPAATETSDEVLGVMGQCFGATAEGKVTTGIGIDTRYEAIIPSGYTGYENERSIYLHSASNIGLKTHPDTTPVYNDDGSIQSTDLADNDRGSIYLTCGSAAPDWSGSTPRSGGMISLNGRLLSVNNQYTTFSGDTTKDTEVNLVTFEDTTYVRFDDVSKIKLYDAETKKTSTLQAYIETCALDVAKEYLESIEGQMVVSKYIKTYLGD